MDDNFLAALVASVGLWIDTGRENNPNVCVPIDKLEGFLNHITDLEGRVDAANVERDAALFQLRVQDGKLDEAEARLDGLTDG